MFSDVGFFEREIDERRLVVRCKEEGERERGVLKKSLLRDIRIANLRPIA